MEKDTETDSESFTVLEMPIGLKSIRMDVAELRRFCKEYKLPMFCLKAEVQVHNGVDFPLQNKYRKLFTLKWDWCLFAVEKLAEDAPPKQYTDEEFAQDSHSEFEQLPADEEGQIGFRRKDGKVVIV